LANITEDHLKLFGQHVAKGDLTEDSVKKSSSAALPLFQWLVVLEKYLKK